MRLLALEWVAKSPTIATSNGQRSQIIEGQIAGNPSSVVSRECTTDTSTGCQSSDEASSSSGHSDGGRKSDSRSESDSELERRKDEILAVVQLSGEQLQHQQSY